METPVTDPSKIESMFGPGKKNEDGSVTWNLSGPEAAQILGFSLPSATPDMPAIPPIPQPPRETETVGPPIFIPSSKGRVLRTVLLAAVLLTVLLQLGVSVAILVRLVSGPAR